MIFQRRNWSSSRSIKMSALACLCILFLLSVYFSAISISPLQAPSNIAIVYARPTFHDEVASALACMLHSLGYYVVVYIGSGVHVGSVMIPFSGQRHRNSAAFYGACVNEWVTIRPNMKTFSHAEIVVFVTYPMVIHDFKKDSYAHQLLGILHDEQEAQQKSCIHSHQRKISAAALSNTPSISFSSSSGSSTSTSADSSSSSSSSSSGSGSTSVNINVRRLRSSQESSEVKSVSTTRCYHPQVVYIAHRSEEFIDKSMESLRSVVSWNQSTFLFLGEHSQKTAAANLAKSTSPFLVQHHSEARLSHLYPVFPMEYISGQSDGAEGQSGSGWGVDAVDTVMRFWDRLIELSWHEQGQEQALFGIQGNFGGRHKYRKDPRGVADCLRGIERGLPPGTHYNGSIYPPLTTTSAKAGGAGGAGGGAGGAGGELSSSSASRIRVSLDVIGNILEPLKLGEFETGRIRYLDKLSSALYYRAISRVKFLLVGGADRAYLTSRATSSVPAALIARVPLVASKEMLSIYPCLRDAPIHQSIARETECHSLYAASALTDEQYRQAKAEIENCSEVLWEAAKAELKRIAAST